MTVAYVSHSTRLSTLLFQYFLPPFQSQFLAAVRQAKALILAIGLSSWIDFEFEVRVFEMVVLDLVVTYYQ